MRLIDADALWKDITSNIEYCSDILEILERQPTIEPERTGKWIECDGDLPKTMCKCSDCGAMIDIDEKYRNFFCYHCGVKMKEPEDIPMEYFESGGR